MNINQCKQKNRFFKVTHEQIAEGFDGETQTERHQPHITTNQIHTLNISSSEKAANAQFNGVMTKRHQIEERFN